MTDKIKLSDIIEFDIDPSIEPAMVAFIAVQAYRQKKITAPQLHIILEIASGEPISPFRMVQIADERQF